MPNQAIPPPGVDLSDWISAQRASQLSDILTQSAFTPEQPQQLGKVASRISPLSIPAKLIQAIMAKRSFNKASTLNAQNYAKALEQFQNTGNGTLDNQSQPVSQTPSGQPSNSAPSSSLSIPGVDARTAFNLYMNSPAEYAKLKMGPESVQLGRLAGISAPQAASAALTKQTAIEGRPGSTIIDPVTGQDIVFADPSKGEYYIHGANGKLYALPITNDAQIQASRAGGISAAETAAKVTNTPQNIEMGGGRTGLAYPTDIIGAPPALRGTSGNSSGPKYFPPSSLSAPSPPETAQSTGVKDPWQNIPKLSIPNTPGQSTDIFHQKILADAAAKHSELVNKYGSEADLADQKMQYNAEASKSLPNAEVGPLSGWLTENRARLIELGVPPKLLPGSGTVTPTMELNKFLKNAALQGARQIYGPHMTQIEVKLQTDEMSPSAHMTADAIQSLINQDNIRNSYYKQRARDYGQYIENSGDPMRFESWYATRFPLTKYAAHFHQDLEAEMQKRGLQ